MNIIWVPGVGSLQEMEALMRLVAQKLNQIFEFHDIPLRLRANQVYTRPDADANWRPTNEEELLPKCRHWANTFGRVAQFVPYEFSGALW